MRAKSPPKPEELTQHLSGRPEIVFAVLYGSAVDGERYRDLDVGIMVDRAHVPIGSLAPAVTAKSARPLLLSRPLGV